jgi:hypothetical protein
MCGGLQSLLQRIMSNMTTKHVKLIDCLSNGCLMSYQDRTYKLRTTPYKFYNKTIRCQGMHSG